LKLAALAGLAGLASLGACGGSGKSWQEGAAGTTGVAGTTGTAGVTGAAGTTGVAGTTGAAGTGVDVGAVSYYKDVEPILKQHCQSCHSPGNIAPFSLMTYADAKPTAGIMAGATAQHIMPPWMPKLGW
jgi:hypothetical protein